MQISEIFNNDHIDFVENITGKRQDGSHFVSLNNQEQVGKEKILDNSLEKYSQHPSIINIKTNLPHDKDVFQFSKAEPSDILKIIRGLKSVTAVGVDNIPPEIVIMSVEVIVEPLTNLINSTMLNYFIFPNVEERGSTN